jgi:hypothetical protein
MSTGLFGVPVTWFVCESVVWYKKLAGTIVTGAMLHPCAVVMPLLIIVAKAVAG